MDARRASAGGTSTWPANGCDDCFLRGIRHRGRSVPQHRCQRAVQRLLAHARCCTAAIFDSRFRGYGQEHVEHTRRLLRVGYGGTYEEIDGEVRPLYKLLKSSIAVTNPDSFSNPPDRDRNWLMCHELLFDEAYRMPWRDDAELMQFRQEMADAARKQ